jgi:translation initiation factor IF-3
MAEAAKLDLVQIAADAEPVVCKIMDYGKQVFEVKKQKAAAKKKQKQTQVKEIKFRPGTDVGDYQVKLRNLIRFLELLKRVEVDLAEYAGVEQYPKMEGRQLTMVLAPKKRK